MIFLTAILILSLQLKKHMIILYRIHNRVVTTCKQHLQICSHGSWPTIKPHQQQKLLKLHGAKIFIQARWDKVETIINLHILGDNVVLLIIINFILLLAQSQVLLLVIAILMFILRMIVIYHSTTMEHILSKRLVHQMLAIAHQVLVAHLFAAKKPAIREDFIPVDG